MTTCDLCDKEVGDDDWKEIIGYGPSMYICVACLGPVLDQKLKDKAAQIDIEDYFDPDEIIFRRNLQ